MIDPGDQPDEHMAEVVFQADAVDLDGMGRLAGHLAAAILPGDLILLYGPLGAGKTTLVRLLADRLGVVEQVRSPSFTIANIYDGPIPVFHLDLYRLEAFDDEDVLALEEYVSPDVVTIVEWPEAGRSRLGDATWIVRLGHRDLDTRVVVLEAADETVRARWRQAS